MIAATSLGRQMIPFAFVQLSYGDINDTRVATVAKVLDLSIDDANRFMRRGQRLMMSSLDEVRETKRLLERVGVLADVAPPQPVAPKRNLPDHPGEFVGDDWRLTEKQQKAELERYLSAAFNYYGALLHCPHSTKEELRVAREFVSCYTKCRSALKQVFVAGAFCVAAGFALIGIAVAAVVIPPSTEVVAKAEALGGQTVDARQQVVQAAIK